MIFTKLHFSAVAFSLTLLTGCTALPPDTQERLGEFTAISTFNVSNLSYKLEENSGVFTQGKVCYEVDMRTLEYISGPKDSLIQRAIDDAIRNGQFLGIDGDVLVNARLDRETEYTTTGTFIKSKKRFECLVVQGDLVKVNP